MPIYAHLAHFGFARPAAFQIPKSLRCQRNLNPTQTVHRLQASHHGQRGQSCTTATNMMRLSSRITLLIFQGLNQPKTDYSGDNLGDLTDLIRKKGDLSQTPWNFTVDTRWLSW